MIKRLTNVNYHKEQVYEVLSSKIGIISVNILTPILLSALLYDFVPLKYLISLVFVQLVIAFFKYNISKKCTHTSKVNKRSVIIYFVLIFLSALFLVSFLLLALYYSGIKEVLFILLVLYAISAGSLTTLTPIFHAVFIFIFTILSTSIIGLIFIKTDPFYLFVAIFVFICLVIIVPLTFKIYKLIENNILKKETIKSHHKKLIELERMSASADMAENISHQWRQPLNLISTIATGVIQKKEFGILDVEKIIPCMEKINKSAQYLSETIDTFSDIIKNDKEYKKLTLRSEISQAIQIINFSLQSNNIKLINSIPFEEELYIRVIKGELSQVILSILDNAQDALIQRDIQNPYIEISLLKKDEKAIITIEDNAKGIPNDIIDKIFEAYFTTKHQSKGIGMGLNLSYKIVTQSIKGNLYVKNTKNGAMFFIEVPLINI
jgi:signal transduction histidine kinase